MVSKWEEQERQAQKYMELVGLSQWVIKDEAETEKSQEYPAIHLDDRLLESPAVAVSSVLHEVVQMGELVARNIRDSVECIRTRDTEKLKQVHALENHLDEVNNIWQQLMSMQEFEEEPKEA